MQDSDRRGEHAALLDGAQEANAAHIDKGRHAAVVRMMLKKGPPLVLQGRLGRHDASNLTAAGL